MSVADISGLTFVKFTLVPRVPPWRMPIAASQMITLIEECTKKATLSYFRVVGLCLPPDWVPHPWDRKLDGPLGACVDEHSI